MNFVVGNKKMRRMIKAVLISKRTKIHDNHPQSPDPKLKSKPSSTSLKNSENVRSKS